VNRQKLHAAALALPLLGLFLLISPIIRLFGPDKSLGGVSLVVLYIFGVWILLIVLAFVLARMLVRDEMPAAGPTAADGAADADEPPC
tara:strand:+ start:435 stop:698 length:264 start_codon:yes stop_codon:yes gene_type:complete